jgi:hypothetical protein
MSPPHFTPRLNAALLALSIAQRLGLPAPRDSTTLFSSISLDLQQKYNGLKRHQINFW